MLMLRSMVVFFLLGSVQAWSDVGMITQTSGKVSITSGDRVQAAVPFYKVSAGERLVMEGGARVQLVYFGNGRQEVWSDAGQIEVGSLESKSAGKPQVTQLPPLVINQLAKTPAAGQQGKVGMVRMRSLAKPDAIYFEKQYKELKATAAADDTTPEVFLISGLIEIQEFARAKELLVELGKNAAYKAVIDHFSPIVAAGLPK
jgi:hypothetical protein